MRKTASEIAGEVLVKCGMPFKPSIRKTEKLIEKLRKTIAGGGSSAAEARKALDRETKNLRDLRAMQKGHEETIAHGTKTESAIQKAMDELSRG